MTLNTRITDQLFDSIKNLSDQDKQRICSSAWLLAGELDSYLDEISKSQDICYEQVDAWLYGELKNFNTDDQSGILSSVICNIEALEPSEINNALDNAAIDTMICVDTARLDKLESQIDEVIGTEAIEVGTMIYDILRAASKEINAMRRGIE